MTNDNPDNRYYKTKVYSKRQLEIEASVPKPCEFPTIPPPWGLPEEELIRLREMTPEEQWELHDKIISLKHLLDSVVNDCFDYDRVFGWSLKK